MGHERLHFGFIIHLHAFFEKYIFQSEHLLFFLVHFRGLSYVVCHSNRSSFQLAVSFSLSNYDISVVWLAAIYLALTVSSTA